MKNHELTPYQQRLQLKARSLLRRAHTGKADDMLTVPDIRLILKNARLRPHHIRTSWQALDKLDHHLATATLAKEIILLRERAELPIYENVADSVRFHKIVYLADIIRADLAIANTTHEEIETFHLSEKRKSIRTEVARVMLYFHQGKEVIEQMDREKKDVDTFNLDDFTMSMAIQLDTLVRMRYLISHLPEKTPLALPFLGTTRHHLPDDLFDRSAMNFAQGCDYVRRLKPYLANAQMTLQEAGITKDLEEAIHTLEEYLIFDDEADIEETT
jgi:hypothetical protein